MVSRATGREIGQLQTLREFDLSHPAVQAKLKERYGNRISLTEKVISPARMFESEELVTVGKIKIAKLFKQLHLHLIHLVL